MGPTLNTRLLLSRNWKTKQAVAGVLTEPPAGTVWRPARAHLESCFQLSNAVFIRTLPAFQVLNLLLHPPNISPSLIYSLLHRRTAKLS